MKLEENKEKLSQKKRMMEWPTLVSAIERSWEGKRKNNTQTEVPIGLKQKVCEIKAGDCGQCSKKK